MMKNTSIFILVLFSGFGCHYKSDNKANEENELKETYRLDSIRKRGCDSLLHLIYETNSWKVKLPGAIPKNVDECMTQLDTCSNDSIKIWIRCTTESEYLSMQLGFGKRIRDKWQLWGETDLTRHFNSRGISSPVVMTKIILQCFHQFIHTGGFALNEKIVQHYESLKRREAEQGSLEQSRKQHFKESNAFIDSLHKAINYKAIFQNVKGLVADGFNFYIVEYKGDTLCLGSVGSISRITKSEYLKAVRNERLGKTLFFSHIGDDGGIYDRRLKWQRFIKRNGDLFFEVEPKKYVKIFTQKMVQEPNFIQRWKPINACSLDRSFIKTQWRCKNKIYYYLELNGDCRGTGLQVRYLIDQDLNVIFNAQHRNELWKCEKIIDR